MPGGGKGEARREAESGSDRRVWRRRTKKQRWKDPGMWKRCVEEEEEEEAVVAGQRLHVDGGNDRALDRSSSVPEDWNH